MPDWPGHRAGQHVDVRLTAEDGYQAERSYSIASAAEWNTRRAHSRAARRRRGLAVPDRGGCRPATGSSSAGPVGGYFVWEPTLGGPVLLVAGGSGVVPLMAMIRTRRAAGSDAEMRLLLSSRSWDDVIYREELGGATASPSSIP